MDMDDPSGKGDEVYSIFDICSAVLAKAVQQGIKTSHIREVSTVESILSAGDPLFNAIKPKRSKGNAGE